AIDIVVRDGAGNVATAHRDYVVEEPPVTATGFAPGASSGILLRAGGLPTVVTYGDRVQLTVGAFRNGTPLTGRRLHITGSRGELATGLADDRGVGLLQFVALASSQLSITADDSGLQPLTAQLAVAPRVTIAVSTARPRRGRAVKVRGQIAPVLPGRKLLL